MKHLLLIITIGVLLFAGYLLLKSQTPVGIGSNPLANDSIENKSANNILDLSSQGLKKIPDDVFGQTNLEELNISYNQINGAIQAEIKHLKNLKVLNAGNNDMTGVPAEIGQLHQLEVLNLANNQLTGLPYELGNLQKLKILNVSGNNYAESDLSVIIKKLPRDVHIIK